MQADSAFDVQVGGSHYKDCWMQPATFWLRNQLPATEGAVLKYMFRWPAKAGVEDLRKARHFVEMMIEAYYVGRWARPTPKNWVITPKEFCQGNDLDTTTTLVIVNALDFKSMGDLQFALLGIDQLIIDQEFRDHGKRAKGTAPNMKGTVPVNTEKLRAQNAIFVAINRLEAFLQILNHEGPLSTEQRANQRMLVERNLKFLRQEARA